MENMPAATPEGEDEDKRFFDTIQAVLDDETTPSLTKDALTKRLRLKLENAGFPNVPDNDLLVIVDPEERLMRQHNAVVTARSPRKTQQIRTPAKRP